MTALLGGHEQSKLNKNIQNAKPKQMHKNN